VWQNSAIYPGNNPIVNEHECCTVGFLQKYPVGRAIAEGCNNQFVKVLTLYSQSPNIVERRKDHINKGMALCMKIAAVDGIQSLE